MVGDVEVARRRAFVPSLDLQPVGTGENIDRVSPGEGVGLLHGGAQRAADVGRDAVAVSGHGFNRIREEPPPELLRVHAPALSAQMTTPTAATATTPQRRISFPIPCRYLPHLSGYADTTYTTSACCDLNSPPI
ncbi:MAG: hypothetical protein HYV63_22310 [Candidatus Schekmanbacteria bacterium]|nr:hypothetical protein [Candidatus Schekmanbacteria bacterium]